MNEKLIAKLDALVERHEELASEMSEPDAAADANRFQALSREYAQLTPLSDALKGYRETQEELAQLAEMLTDDDQEIREMAVEDQKSAQQQLEALEKKMFSFLVPKDPHDDSNIFLEVRAGTGGDEAALFAGDLLKMYLNYADSQNWQVEILSQSDGEHGGYKEVIARLIGHGAYSKLKFESGAHRVQRVPETESQGRIHTSACTVAILPELDEIEEIDIAASDLRIDTYRASGAGGQHVNKTDSAVRITHHPTGIVVECQDERSQHKNRARAMSLLKSRMLDSQQQAQASAQAQERKKLVGSGDRSERIRTYNFPQGRVTDHRINLTLYRLDEILLGKLDCLIEPLSAEHEAEAMQDMDI